MAERGCTLAVSHSEFRLPNSGFPPARGKFPAVSVCSFRRRPFESRRRGGPLAIHVCAISVSFCETASGGYSISIAWRMASLARGAKADGDVPVLVGRDVVRAEVGGHGHAARRGRRVPGLSQQPAVDRDVHRSIRRRSSATTRQTSGAPCTSRAARQACSGTPFPTGPCDTTPGRRASATPEGRARRIGWSFRPQNGRPRVHTQLFQSTNSTSLPALIRIAGFCSGKTSMACTMASSHVPSGFVPAVKCKTILPSASGTRLWNDSLYGPSWSFRRLNDVKIRQHLLAVDVEMEGPFKHPGMFRLGELQPHGVEPSRDGNGIGKLFPGAAILIERLIFRRGRRVFDLRRSSRWARRR